MSAGLANGCLLEAALGEALLSHPAPSDDSLGLRASRGRRCVASSLPLSWLRRCVLGCLQHVAVDRSVDPVVGLTATEKEVAGALCEFGIRAQFRELVVDRLQGHAHGAYNRQS